MSDNLTKCPVASPDLFKASKLVTASISIAPWTEIINISKMYSAVSIVKASTILATMNNDVFPSSKAVAFSVADKLISNKMDIINQSISPKMKILEASNLRFEGIMKLVDSSYATIQSHTVPNVEQSSDDYVIVEASAIREYEVPDDLVIPIGHNRVRISTSLFVTIVGILISIIISLSNSNTEQKEQTKILQNILESVDTTNSSQQEYLEEMRSAVQYSNESHESRPQLTDNMNESLNTESEN